MYCEYCGEVMDNGDLFCSKCGQRQESNGIGINISWKTEQNRKPMIGRNYESTLCHFVDNNSAYYMEKFRRIENGNGGGTNWAVLFVSYFLWALYRKMWGKAFLYLLINVGIVYMQYQALTVSFNIEMSAILGIIRMCIDIYCIASANIHYYNHILTLIELNRLNGVDINETRTRVR